MCNLYNVKNLWIPFFPLIIKILVVCLFAIAVRGTVPRYRFDQATMLNWKHFIFIWLVYLILSVMLVFLFSDFFGYELFNSEYIYNIEITDNLLSSSEFSEEIEEDLNENLEDSIEDAISEDLVTIPKDEIIKDDFVGDIDYFDQDFEKESN